MDRKSGVLMPISSLYGDFSIGSFGRSAKEFVDFLAECRFSYWQVLPFCMADDCNSPYQSYSTFAGNPYFVDLEVLKEKGLITDEELLSQKQQQPYSVEYVRLYHTRLSFLREVSKRVAYRNKIEEFTNENPYIEQFSKFMALKEANGEKLWREWETDDYSSETFFMWSFIQYEFFSQWEKIKNYANSKGIKIIGDVPIYVSLESSDVWANKELFMLDENLLPKFVAGVPPDYFCEDGQLWGNPIYDWDKMRQTGFAWWTDRIAHSFKLFDGVRIDHFRGLESFWAVPYGEKTAKNGKWLKGPGMELIEKINSLFSDKLIIAEDLGEITPQVKMLVEESTYPGMRVIQFGFLSEGDNPHMPHNYKNNCVAYTGTHDNNTLLGYLWELDASNKKRLLEYCNYHSGDFEKGIDSIIRTMFASHAGLVILPIQDILGYGSDTRINIPGKPDGNWQFRITKEQLQTIDKNKFRCYNELYKRV
ncbi:MAG: 4-alpha-glucanotransferase [Ruminococcaceae bacterium]|nr:4-alpha-glucanotransferase [Oscillospiraceae bacterium]